MHFPVEASAESSYVLYIETDAKQGPFQLRALLEIQYQKLSVLHEGKQWKMP